MSPHYGSEQMMARLPAEIRTNREEMKTNQAEMLARMEAKTDVNLKEMKEEIRTNQAKVDGHSKGNETRIDNKAGSQDRS
jgi:hypothetical protein